MARQPLDERGLVLQLPLERVELAGQTGLVERGGAGLLGFLGEAGDLLVGLVELALEVADALRLLGGAGLGHLRSSAGLRQLVAQLRDRLLLADQPLRLLLALGLEPRNRRLGVGQSGAGLLDLALRLHTGLDDSLIGEGSGGSPQRPHKLSALRGDLVGDLHGWLPGILPLCFPLLKVPLDGRVAAAADPLLHRDDRRLLTGGSQREWAGRQAALDAALGLAAKASLLPGKCVVHSLVVIRSQNGENRSMPQPQDAPTWQPISKLPQIAWMIDGMTESAEEVLADLREAEGRPHVLDLPTVDRVIRVYTEQQGDLWLYREQLTRWGKLALTDAQRAEVMRLEERLATLGTHIEALLALAARLRPHTIESIMAKSDVELALDVLTGKIRPPGRRKKV